MLSIAYSKLSKLPEQTQLQFKFSFQTSWLETSTSYKYRAYKLLYRITGT